MSTPVDVRQLAVSRAPAAPAGAGRARFLARVLLPGTILFGFVGVLAWSARASLLPARDVTVTPVLTAPAEFQAEGAPLFQGAGWVEPRPTPTLVTALTEGVIDRLLVVEGQEVELGGPVATLIDADARLALRAAEADRRLRRAEADVSAAALAATKVNFEQPAALQAALAEGEAALAQKQTEQSVLPQQLRAAEAREKIARQDLERNRKLGSGSVAEIIIDRAVADHNVAVAALEELQARQARIGAEIGALTTRRDALKRRLELKVEETRQYAEAQAQVEAADARLKQADVAVEVARLRLERMTVRAPCAGRVLSLVARPGQRLMGMSQASNLEASTVVTLYDPARLQVRADVRLEDVPRVRPGMPVRVETPAAPGGPLTGRVLYPTAQADIQKNTLQVKVSVDAPPDSIRPDMLVQVTFLAPAPDRPAADERRPLRLLVPRALIQSGDGGPRVWIADQAAGVARLRAVRLGPSAGDFVEVVEGLTPADKLIAGGHEGLSDGTRIRVVGESPGLLAPAPASPNSKPPRLPRPAN